jgi:hypothetical protein
VLAILRPSGALTLSLVLDSYVIRTANEHRCKINSCEGQALRDRSTGMACATDSGTVAFYTAPALEPSYSCIELVKHHCEPQRTRRSPVTDNNIID